ncbi:CaiB/BaiF CoA transferase family protein [Sphingomonas sp. SRS2]|uniref:CaiB/BaiF CoA transferase family protein n=1 Tax=Sphingomonas sp. SRS2 TaxID=133190 RepID=UPI000618454F|nr:CaiB/BaiF CoA-transferase family protein [Sphingomonas sp. SRS2]KKC25219.1 carnitine dehydratase [Sphingomonas sp. SRS2]
MNSVRSKGPLEGLRVVEFTSIGPGPHCAMLLSDLGAEVLRIDRPSGNGWPNPIMDRGRALIRVDIRSEEGKSLCIEATNKADVLIEGMRPGVMERLGLGPDILLGHNPRLVYGRMTGWGQTGPLSKSAGHDINYVALTGALAAMGDPDRPPRPPLNLVGDFGGGSLFLAFGIMAALWERERSGKGQVVDAAIIDGVNSMMTMFAGLIPTGGISLDRRTNLLGGAAHFYRCYRCADGLDISVGPIEPQFFDSFMALIGASEELREQQSETEGWEAKAEALSDLFAKRPRADWCRLFEGTDACVAPVLSMDDVPDHPHMKARNSFVKINGLNHAAPAPRFSRTPGAIAESTDGVALLSRWGVARQQIPTL